MGGDLGCGAVRDGVDLGMNFDDLEFSQEGGGSLLGVGAVGSVYRAIHKVSASRLARCGRGCAERNSLQLVTPPVSPANYHFLLTCRHRAPILLLQGISVAVKVLPPPR